ncbi:MAG: prepilin-type N-terminal cleavage/methylation domain-containing protein [bacterium]
MNSKQKRGVTLVELMVVIVLIALLASIASPGIFRAIERQNAQATASGVANALRTARNQAMSRGTPLWARIVPGTTSANRGAVIVSRQGTFAAGNAARSCREYAAGGQVEVFRYSPADLSGRGAIRGGDPVVNLCFSPDGRVLNQTGGLLSATASALRCEGEDAFIYTADFDASITPATHLACPGTANARKALRDTRSLIRMYKISVPFNGNISVEQ